MSTGIVLEEKSNYQSSPTPNYDAAWKNIIEKLFPPSSIDQRMPQRLCRGQ
jgi:hypothetical protein